MAVVRDVDVAAQIIRTLTAEGWKALQFSKTDEERLAAFVKLMSELDQLAASMTDY